MDKKNFTRAKIVLLSGIILLPLFMFSQVRVRGYFRKNGTYVQPHTRSNPDGRTYNNWSSKGNVNPYTGKEGTKDPYPKKNYSGAYSNYSSSSSSSSIYSGSNANYNFGSVTNQGNSTVKKNVVKEVPLGSIKPNPNIKYGAIVMPYYEKEGLSLKESFSLKNESGRDISKISIRMVYSTENNNVIDSKEYVLRENIPNGMAKKFEIDSFDQRYKFVYKYGNSYKPIYTQFIVAFYILDYE
jgi:hypothetical protein